MRSRHRITLIACAVIAVTGPAQAEPILSNREPSLAEVRWTGGFWESRQRACREGSLPALAAIMSGTSRSHFLQNFRIAAGLAEGTHRGADWNDGDTYKWLEALAATFAVTRDPDLERQMNTIIAVIQGAQRSDGYLHTPVLIATRNGDPTARPFGDPVQFEMYNFGHLLTAASVHYEVTGQRRLLDVAIKAADFLDREFQNPSRELARHAICPSHYMGMIDLYRATGESRYLRLVERWLAMRDYVERGGDDNQDRLPLRQQREVVGHAVRANYLFAGVADLYLETRDDTLLSPLENCWRNLVSQKLYITGGCGALFDGASPDGSAQQQSITRVHQAYGRNYQLPNSTAHNETCAAVGSILWNHRMHRISGAAKYADVLETTLYNAALAGVSLDGRRFFYTNTLRQLDRMPTSLRWSREREEWISCFCCPPNIARLIAEVGRYAYRVDRETVSVLLFGTNELDMSLSAGGKLQLSQQSNYPWDGRIQIVVRNAPTQPFTIRLRIPGWCESARLAVNGQNESLQFRADKFAELRRTWRPGDVLELNLDMPVRLVQAHPLVEECRGQIAVQRGPLVYCLESCDLPQGVSITDVVVPADAVWTTTFQPELLAGIATIQGRVQVGASWPTAVAQQQAHPPKTIQPDPIPEEARPLYRTFLPSRSSTIDVSLIPYFAWANRGRVEMTVWLPVTKF